MTDLCFSRLQRTWRPEEIFPPNYNNQQAPIANLSNSLDVEVSLHVSSLKLSDNQNVIKNYFLKSKTRFITRLLHYPTRPCF